MDERKAYNFFISTAVIQLAKQLKGKLDHTNFTYDVEYELGDFYLYELIDGEYNGEPVLLDLYIPAMIAHDQQLTDKCVNEVKKIITKL